MEKSPQQKRVAKQKYLGEKEKMFQFGYTTKAVGSGFGLHSCANFLFAHKGRLEANSEGKAQGAKFVVTLPAVETA